MFRIIPESFTSVNEALSSIAAQLIHDGDTVNLINAIGEPVSTRELLGYSLIFQPEYHNKITLLNRKWRFEKNLAEFFWYMSGSNKVEAIVPYFKNWAKFETNGLVNSNYGRYWRQAFEYLYNELANDKYSRRAVINIYDVKNHENFKKDTPCTLSYQFIIRNDRLNMFVNMRSNDLWYGFCNDQFNNSLFHQLMLNTLRCIYPELDMGQYWHSATSMHVYTGIVPLQKLKELHLEFADSDNSDSSRFELPESVTFFNFWDEDGLMHEQYPDLYEHFVKYYNEEHHSIRG